MPVIPKVDKAHTAEFAKQWRHNGLYVALSDVDIQFATDFANIVLISFVQQCQQEAIAILNQQQTPKPEASGITLEG